MAPENRYEFGVYHNRSGKAIQDKTLHALYDHVLGPVHLDTVRRLEEEFSREE